jgi:hypothetical protein
MSSKVLITAGIFAIVALCLMKRKEEWNHAVSMHTIDQQQVIDVHVNDRNDALFDLPEDNDAKYKQQMQDHYKQYGINDFDLDKHLQEYNEKYDRKPVDIRSEEIIVSGQPTSMNSLDLNPLSNLDYKQYYEKVIANDPNHHAMY